jgi:hypothetical protein
VQYVAVDRVQRARLMQIHDAFVACLRPGATRVIVALADRDSAATVGDVVELQAQHLARAQAAVQHQ